MGCVISSQKRENATIKTYMDAATKHDQDMIKMLLLGARATGKSTLLKSIKAYHNGGEISDRQYERESIWHDILFCIARLIEQCGVLYEKDGVLYKECELIADSNVQQAIDSILQTYHQPSLLHDDCTGNELRLLGEHIEFIWNLDCIQAVYNHRFNNFAINDNMTHFCDNSRLKSIFSVDYTPSTKDCLLNYCITTGLQQYEYSQPNLGDSSRGFRLIDCGGSRPTRLIWPRYFDKFSCYFIITFFW